MNIRCHAYLPRLSAERFIQRIECEFASAALHLAGARSKAVFITLGRRGASRRLEA